MNPAIDSACHVHVLAVTPLESDHIVLAHIFGHTAWEFESVRSLREAVRALEARSPFGLPVILCNEVLPDGSWKDLLDLAQKAAPSVNLIVTSDHADERLWAEVLNVGAYDVLQRPFRAQEVFRTVGLAWTDRRKPVSSSVPTTRISSGAVA